MASRSRIDRGAVPEVIRAVTNLAEKTAEVLEITGEVTMYSKDRKRFTILDRDDGSAYSGLVAASLNKDVVAVGAVHTAKIRAITRVNEATLDEKTEYRLVELNPID